VVRVGTGVIFKLNFALGMTLTTIVPLALYEMLHETKKRGEIGVILKLNFEKAYDKVHWGFLYIKMP
jgi:hypothetical protein